MNVAGLFIPLRNPAIYNETNTCFPKDITLTEKDLWKIIRNSEGLPLKEALPLLADGINKGMACYWIREGAEKYNIRVPAYENYLLYIASKIRPTNYLMFRFCDYRKAIQRGVGYCDQHCIILVELMRERGVKASLVELSGHVIATVEVEPGKWWLVDPEFGIVIQHPLDEVEKNGSRMRDPYLEKGYPVTEVDRLMQIYGPDGNRIAGSVPAYFRSRKCLVEKTAYWLKWIIPTACIILFLALPRRSLK